jgi:hypothetical protein
VVWTATRRLKNCDASCVFMTQSNSSTFWVCKFEICVQVCGPEAVIVSTITYALTFRRPEPCADMILLTLYSVEVGRSYHLLAQFISTFSY